MKKRKFQILHFKSCIPKQIMKKKSFWQKIENTKQLSLIYAFSQFSSIDFHSFLILFSFSQKKISSKVKDFLSNYFAIRLSLLDFLPTREDQSGLSVFILMDRELIFLCLQASFFYFFSTVAGRPKQSEFLTSSQAYTNARQIAFGQMFGVSVTMLVFKNFATIQHNKFPI